MIVSLLLLPAALLYFLSKTLLHYFILKAGRKVTLNTSNILERSLVGEQSNSNLLLMD